MNYNKKEWKMALKEISSLNSLVFHISKSAKDFDLSENYYRALKSLLLEEKSYIKFEDYRKEYDFMAKIIFDEISNKNSGVRENIKKINELIGDYLQTRDSSKGKLLLNCLFHIFLLKLLDHNEHVSGIQSDNIKNFLNEYNPPVGEETYIHNVLSLFYLGRAKIIEIKNENEIELALNLLYYRIKIAKDDEKTKENRLEYYTRQKALEEKINISPSQSPTVQGRLIKIAVILKAISGNGLYIPETEKERYISTFAKAYIKQENNFTIRGVANCIKIKVWGIEFNPSLWLLALIFSIMELILVLIPKSLYLLSNASSYPIIKFIVDCSNNPVIFILINGVIIVTLLLWRQKYINKKHPID